MTYILDTKIVSALMKGDVTVTEKLASVQKQHVRVPQPVFAEIAYSIERLPKSKRRTILEERFELLRTELIAAEWTETVSDAFGRIKATLEECGKRIEDFDAAIAAHAMAEGATLVTANVRHMVPIDGVDVQDWL